MQICAFKFSLASGGADLPTCPRQAALLEVGPEELGQLKVSLLFNSLLRDVQVVYDHSGMREAGQFLLIYELL